MGEMEKNGGKWGEMGENGGKWEIAGIAHRMWVVEGCGGMWLRKMGQKWENNRRKMGQNTHFSQSHFPRFSGG